MGKGMVKEHSLHLMDSSMKENGRMVEFGMEYITTKMDGSILGVGRMVKYGTEQNTTITETSYTGGCMEKKVS